MPFSPVEEEIVFSESPNADIWRRLSALKYPENVRQRIQSWHPSMTVEQATESDVSASIEQAEEYFRAAEHASISTKPVQLYYGSVSLLRALAVMGGNVVPQLGSHGLFHKPQSSGGTVTKDVALVAGGFGGAFGCYSSFLPHSDSISGGSRVQLFDALSCIPELHRLWEDTFQKAPSVLRVERIQDKDGAVADFAAAASVPVGAEKLAFVKKAYLRPQTAGGNRVVFRPRIGKRRDPTIVDLSGRRFLPLGMKTSGGVVNVHLVVPHLVALFILCSLSRYHPYRWRSFCVSSGRERLIVEEYLRVANRFLPNEVLNLIERRRVVFSARRFADEIETGYLPEDQIREMINKSVMRRWEGR